MSFMTTDLCDEYSNELQVCVPMFQQYGAVPKFSGPIATLSVYDDNVLVVEALETLPEGTVLVVDGKGSMNCALLGGRLGGIAESNKLAGIIINGCVRDSVELKNMNVGILGLGTHPLKSGKEGKGEKDVTVHFGGVTWEPGNYVYVDEDGVIVAGRSLIGE